MTELLSGLLSEDDMTVIKGDGAVAGLDGFTVHHLIDKYFSVNHGGLFTHWFYYKGVPKKRITFYEFTNYHRELMQNGLLVKLIKLLQTYNLSMYSILTGTIRYDYDESGGIAFLKKMHYSYVFAHIHKDNTFSTRILKSSYIAPYIEKFSKDFKLIELVCKTPDMKFEFTPDDLNRFHSMEEKYIFETTKGMFEYIVYDGQLIPKDVKRVAQSILEQICNGQKHIRIDNINNSEAVNVFIKEFCEKFSFNYLGYQNQFLIWK